MMNENFIIPKWPAPENIRAIQTTRNGGVSLKNFSSLNLSNSVGDIEQYVEEKYKRL